MANKTLVAILEELAAELRAKGIALQSDPLPAVRGEAAGFIRSALHIRERIATYKAIGVGDTVVMASGPMAGKPATVVQIVEEGGLYSLEYTEGGQIIARGGAYFNEIRKVL